MDLLRLDEKIVETRRRISQHRVEMLFLEMGSSMIGSGANSIEIELEDLLRPNDKNVETWN